MNLASELSLALSEIFNKKMKGENFIPRNASLEEDIKLINATILDEFQMLETHFSSKPLHIVRIEIDPGEGIVSIIWRKVKISIGISIRTNTAQLRNYLLNNGFSEDIDESIYFIFDCNTASNTPSIAKISPPYFQDLDD